MTVLVLAARVFLAAWFAASVAHKLRDTAGFVTTVDQYRLLPRMLAAPAAFAITGAEVLAIGGLLWLPSALGPVVAVLLLGLFALAMAINLLRGRREIACGCSLGTAADTIGWGLVARNGLLAVVALAGAAGRVWPTGALDWVDGLGAGVAVFCLVRVMTSLFDLRALARSLQARSH